MRFGRNEIMTKQVVRILALVLLLLVSQYAGAQWLASLDNQIRTLGITVAGDWERMPVVNMNANESIEFHFDEMSHNYHRYTYKVEHCNAEWKTSDLLESDYLDGFNGETIDDWQNSLNTTFDYTHYTLTIPNQNVTLKLSGNYRLSIMEDDMEVAWFRFCLSENKVLLQATVSGNTDIDTNEKHHQLSPRVNYGQLGVTDPSRELHTVVMQNGRWDNAVRNAQPTYNAGNNLTYEHSRQLILPAGNEFRRFEVLDMYQGFMNVDRMNYYNPYWHASLIEDLRFRSYRMDFDHNGRYMIRRLQSDDSNTQADYVFVHFCLRHDLIPGGKMYINGHFTGGNLSPEYEMEYNSEQNCYEATILLKQGAYDYQYLWVPNGSQTGQTRPIEGDWYETSNDYLMFLYYRQRGARYDRLVSTLAF